MHSLISALCVGSPAHSVASANASFDDQHHTNTNSVDGSGRFQATMHLGTNPTQPTTSNNGSAALLEEANIANASIMPSYPVYPPVGGNFSAGLVNPTAMQFVASMSPRAVTPTRTRTPTPTPAPAPTPPPPPLGSLQPPTPLLMQASPTTTALHLTACQSPPQHQQPHQPLMTMPSPPALGVAGAGVTQMSPPPINIHAIQEAKEKLKQEKKEKHATKKLIKELAVCKTLLGEMEVGIHFKNSLKNVLKVY